MLPIQQQGILPNNTPAKLPKHQILQLLKSLKIMKDQGIDNRNPKYQSIVALLKTQDLKQYFKDNSSPTTTPSPTPTDTNEVNSPPTFDHAPIASVPTSDISPAQLLATPKPPEIPIHNAPPKQDPILEKPPALPVQVPLHIQSSDNDLSKSNVNQIQSNNTIVSNQNIQLPNTIQSKVPPAMPVGQMQPPPMSVPQTHSSATNFQQTPANIQKPPPSIPQKYDSTPRLISVGNPPHNPQNHKVQHPTIFTPEQIKQLRAQIAVYKKLMSRVEVLPEHVRLCFGKSYPPGNINRTSHPMNHYPISRPTAPKPPAALPVPKPSSGPPPPMPVPKAIPSHPQPITPRFDMATLINDRESRIRVKLTNKFRSISSQETISEEEEVEKEKIKLLGIQHKLRNDIAQYIQIAVHNKNSAKGTTRRKRTRGDKRKVKNQKKLSKEKEFLHDIMTHCKNMKDFYHIHSQKWKKINRQMMNFHATKARREEQQREREAKERLRALRENDEVGYLKLLEKVKNERLSQLLNQTDDYLNQIGLKVREAKDQGGEMASNIKKKDLSEMTEEEKKKVYETRRRRSKTI